MVQIGSISISPILINTACAWASDLSQLQALFDSPHTGAVTTRTATLDGYKESDANTVVFTGDSSISSLNSYGYSPHPLSIYLEWIENILSSDDSGKPFIISLAATNSTEMETLIAAVQALRTKIDDQNPAKPARIAIEFNTSCPNMGPDTPPTGYVFESLRGILVVLDTAHQADPTLTIGLKMPPYIYHLQFVQALDILHEFCLDGRHNSFAFLTCTNTLGNSLLFPEQIAVAEGPVSTACEFAVPTAVGGLAGDALHALSLGNVYSFCRLLRVQRPNKYDGLKNMVIIGVGGVTSKAAAARMRQAGANVVGVATLFGQHGVEAFEMLTI